MANRVLRSLRDDCKSTCDFTSFSSAEVAIVYFGDAGPACMLRLGQFTPKYSTNVIIPLFVCILQANKGIFPLAHLNQKFQF